MNSVVKRNLSTKYVVNCSIVQPQEYYSFFIFGTTITADCEEITNDNGKIPRELTMVNQSVYTATSTRRRQNLMASKPCPTYSTCSKSQRGLRHLPSYPI